MSNRKDRVASQIIDILSEMILRDLKDPRIGFVTLTGAEVSADLRYVKVFISVLGEEEARKQCLKALNGASGMMRGEVTRRARLRVAPEITFHYDTGLEHGQRIFSLLCTIEEERKLNPIRESVEEAETP